MTTLSAYKQIWRCRRKIGAYVFRQLVINDPWPNFNARTRELTTLRRTRNSKDKIFNMETFKRYTTSGLSC